MTQTFITISAMREEYNLAELQDTMTVGELIERLSAFDPNTKIALSHDGGYTYGGIYDYSFNDETVETED